MNHEFQFEFDPLTGVPTSILDERADERVRAACIALNRRRTRGVLEAALKTAPREQISADVWNAAFATGADAWEVPLVDISKLGLRHEDEGFLVTDFLERLKSGAEAAPFMDVERRVVYKLFDLRPSGSLGKKLELLRVQDCLEVRNREATYVDILEKMNALTIAGALPSEIVGFADNGAFLITKQPLAKPLLDYEKDRKTAVEAICGTRVISRGQANIPAVISFIDDTPWLVGDLHERNIMHTFSDQPTIIDALLCKLNPSEESIPWMKQAVRDARIYRETGKPPEDLFDSVPDDEL